MLKRHLIAPVAAVAAALLVLPACSATDAGVARDDVEIADVGTVSAAPELADAVPASVKSTGLRLVVAAPFPPFEQFDENNELEGVDVDLANAIGAKLGLTVTISNVNFAGVIPALQSGEANLALAGMQDTPERQEVVSFVDYSTDSGARLVVPKDSSLSTFADFCGRKVGIESGTTYGDTVTYNSEQLCSDAGLPPVETVNQTSQGTLLALQSGAIDGLLTSGISASVLVDAESDKVSLLEDAAAPDGYADSEDNSPTFTGIAVLKRNTELFDAVYAAADALAEDGTTSKIFAKWGVAGHEVVPPTKNLE